MAHLTIGLLGRPSITCAGQPLELRLRKELALLAFLAAEQEHRHSREALAGLLWPDDPEETARNNLRVVLAGLRRQLGAAGAGCLAADRQHVRFVPESEHALDVRAFRELLAAVRAHAHGAAERCEACVARLAEAADLYQGEFLAGFSLSDSPPFDEWATVMREHLHQQQLQAVEMLTTAAELRGDHAAQVGYARRQLALEPWREVAYAQLMRGLWASGQRSAALDQYETCRRILADELGLEPSPELATLAEQLRAATSPRVAAPPAATPDLKPAPRYQLPAELTSFVGRDEQIAAIADALDGARLVTLTGPGGCGKTRLAIRVAAEVANRYADGLRLVELASLDDPALLLQAVAAALGLRESSGRPLRQLLADELQDRQLLLLLDSCEHLVEACRALAEPLLRACPGLTMLATSRELLRVPGERVWPIPAMVVPGPEVATPELLLAYDSIRLFVERAAAVAAHFALSAANGPAVAQICRRLDGIPLAIELAAARVRHMPIEALAAGLDNSLSLLTATNANAPPHQRTLRATLDWSYARLTAAEQVLLRGLAVFAGGCTLQAIEAVAAEQGTQNKALGRERGSEQLSLSDADYSLLDLLSQLVDKSLLLVEHRNATPRYRMLETVRAYGLEQLAAAGETELARDRHQAYFLALAEAAESHWFGANQVAWLDLIALEHDNLRAALDRAMAGADAHAALRMVTSLRSFWYTRGHYDEGRQRILRALALPAAQARTALRASALNAAGAHLWAGGSADEAQHLLEQALAIGREVGDELNTGWALLHMGMIAYQQGDYPAAQQALESGLAGCQLAGPQGRRGVGWGLIFLGDLALHSGDAELARSRFEASVALLRELADYGLLAYPLRRLGHMALQQGDFITATARCAESLQLNQAIDDRLAVAACLAALAAIAAAEGQAATGAQRMQHLRHAANLCGAVAAQLEAIGAPLWPADAAALERLELALREQLGAVAFARARAAGRDLSIDQLLSLPVSPTADASAPPGHSLPEPITPCIGREAEMAALAELLHKPEVRLVTLVGVGGMGKTRLAQELGRASISAFADGVFFAPLAPISTPAALVGAIATALGVALQGRDPLRALLQMLRQKQLLLILDNFEHLLVGRTDAVDLVAELIGAAPGVRLLVTSREGLKLRGEHVYMIQALTFSATASLEEAANLAAVRLFVQSVRRVQAGFELTAANLAAVLRICDLVQGMPLGLELAAAKAGGLPLSAIADAIEQSADFLAVDWRDVPERQRSMRAVFAWSWQLLSAEERRVLRQSSEFRAGFAFNAAQAVTGATPPLLARLAEKSLLQWQATASGEGRYTMHELLRQFAAEQLDVAGERAVTEQRHSHYYMVYLAARGWQLGRAKPTQASSEIQAELDNIRTAWQWAIAHGQLAELEQATYAWWQFCQFQGLGFEGQQSFAVAVDGIRRHLAQTEADAATVLGQRLLAKLLALHANYLFANGHDAEMAAQAREAVTLGTTWGGVEGETFGTFVLGRALQDLEHKREAGEMWQRTLQLVHRYQTEYPESELLHEAHWMAHEYLRGSALHFGDYAGSRAHNVQALQICQSLGKRRGELYCLADLAGLDYFLYNVAAAEAGFEATLELARSLNYRRVEMVAQAGLGGALRLRGDYASARRLLEQAVGMAAEAALPYDEALFLAALIRLHCQIGDQAAATQRYDQLTQLLAHVKLPKECQLYAYLAAASKAHAAGVAQEALQYAEQAELVNQQGGDILFRLVDTALILGHMRAAVGQSEAASAAFGQALAAFEHFGNRALAAEPQAGLAGIALAQGDLAGAQIRIEAILPVLAEQPHVGYNNPFSIYLTCYRVLATAGDSRAGAVLRQGYELLHQDAAGLEQASRQRFLHGVRIHRDLLAAYAEVVATPGEPGRQAK